MIDLERFRHLCKRPEKDHNHERCLWLDRALEILRIIDEDINSLIGCLFVCHQKNY